MGNKLTFTDTQQPAKSGIRSTRLQRVSKLTRALLPGRYQGSNRALYYSMALLIFLTAITPAVQMFVDHTVYNLDSKANALVGEPNVNLARKFSYNPDTKTYVFNEKQKVSEDSELPVEVQLMQHKLGGGGKDDKTLYSVDLPDDLTKGMTYYDNNLGLSFDLVPKFTTGKGKLEQNRLVYVNPDGGPKMVFTAMNNGLKEDMVFDEAPLSPDQTWQYNLNLPDTLQARTMSDGGVGIYSADPSLYKNVSFSGEQDEEKIKSARTAGEKSNLVFAIPAPFIKQSGNAAKGNAKASFVLSRDGKVLTVDATGLDKNLAYPLTVDPSVVITSTSDFATGNNEGNISYPTDALGGGTLTGGSIGSWTATTSLLTARGNSPTVAYNGYIYALSGSVNGFGTGAVEYAPLNSNGTVGTWQNTTAMADLAGHTAVAYNGYMYSMGGNNMGGSVAAVSYAPINANGTLGAWSATSSLVTARSNHSSIVYNGYLYVFGGTLSFFAWTPTVEYAPINANGTVGTWATTTALPAELFGHSSVVYNGYVYVTGGLSAGTYYDSVQYAPLNANGTVGAWALTTAFSVGRTEHASLVYNGYLYIIGGEDGTLKYDTVQYAPINANRTVGTWSATTSKPTTRYNLSAAVYNGYLYIVGGYDGTNWVNNVNYSAINPAGVTASYATTTAFTTARIAHASAAYNGYLYVIGGDNNAGTWLTNVQYAPINASGTIGTWTSTTVLTTARSGLDAVAYNGYLYVLGGENSGGVLTTVQYAALNATTGAVGAWATGTAFPTARGDVAAVAYNGYIYALGGFNGTTNLNTVLYATLNATTGAMGAWTAGTVLTTIRSSAQAIAHNGYLYVLGGISGGAEINTVQYATINMTTGAVGTWNTTTSLTTARQGHQAVVNNGYVYVVGGYDVVTGIIDTVQYATLNNDGTLGSWATSTSLPAVRDVHQAVSYNGFMYALGGWNGTTVNNTVVYARINNGGSGTTGTWTTTGTITTARYGHTSVAVNGYLYNMGGYTTATYAGVQKGTIGVAGAVSWTGTTSLPAGRTYAAAATYNGYIYVTGGGDNVSTMYPTVYYAKPNATGDIASWTPGTDFSLAGPARYRHSSVAYNGYLYVIGGSNNTPTYYNTVLYAPLNATDGSVGAWNATTSFMAPNRHRHSSVVYNGYVYVISGTNETVYYNDIQYAPLNSDGTITTGAWKYTTMQTPARYSAPTIAYNGYMYMIGGRYASTYYNDVQYAPINTNGTLGEWQHTTDIITARQAHTGVVNNGYMYVMGGSSGTDQSDSQFAPINTMPRVGKYSKLFNLGDDILSSITYNGSLSAGADSITYKVAPDTGVFGATVYNSDTLPGGLPTSCSASGGSSPTNYVLLTVTFDDSNEAGFPDVNSANSNVTDITVSSESLRSPTNQRLFHGKWFKSQVQQPLDTCAT